MTGCRLHAGGIVTPLTAAGGAPSGVAYAARYRPKNGAGCSLPLESQWTLSSQSQGKIGACDTIVRKSQATAAEPDQFIRELQPCSYEITGRVTIIRDRHAMLEEQTTWATAAAEATARWDGIVGALPVHLAAGGRRLCIGQRARHVPRLRARRS